MVIIQFSVLGSEEFIFLSLISLIAGLLGQIDLGFTNNLSVAYLSGTKREVTKDNENNHMFKAFVARRNGFSKLLPCGFC